MDFAVVQPLFADLGRCGVHPEFTPAGGGENGALDAECDRLLRASPA
ncbi:hypothetical protein [Streptomyces kronopolitis]